MNTLTQQADTIETLSLLQLSALPAPELATLLDDLAERKSRLADLEQKLASALDLRYGARASQRRAEMAKDTGAVRFDDNGYVVVADLPKRVKWDQEKLRHAVEIIRSSWNDDPADYVKTKLEVSESAFTNWPRVVRELFQPARTVETGRPAYRLEKRKAGEAQ
ncbi:MAG: hypothetical protein Q8M31_24045 [Beijerinckiaceae bacterium]|nr:hypothetical protein [Beijerinckiaceae bacterium]